MGMERSDEDFRAKWVDARDLKRFIPFDLADPDWVRVTHASDGKDSGNFPESLVGRVDFEKYWDQGMWTAYIDAGAFNILGIKLGPNFTIPRHHHNIHQLVFVHEGEVWSGSQVYRRGGGYFTRAGHSY